MHYPLIEAQTLDNLLNLPIYTTTKLTNILLLKLHQYILLYYSNNVLGFHKMAATLVAKRWLPLW